MPTFIVQLKGEKETHEIAADRHFVRDGFVQFINDRGDRFEQIASFHPDSVVSIKKV
jgi:hypothetical protein